MKLREEILKEHSKVQCTKIVNWVGNDQQRFDELFQLFLHDEDLVVQRACWPLSYAVIAHPPLISKHWKALISNLKKSTLHNAVKRNSLKLMEEIKIPVKHHGIVMDLCFRFLESPTEAFAVKVYAMSVLGNFTKKYPEIKAELKLLIEDQLTHQSAGFKSSARKVLKAIA